MAEESITPNETDPPPPDSGLVCLALLAKLFEKPADYEALRHCHGAPSLVVGEIDLIRYAREVGFKASGVDSSFEKLAATPLPAIARRHDGSWFILAKVEGGQAIIHDPLVGRAEQVSAADLAERWEPGST